MNISAEELKNWRRDAGLTQRELAGCIGVLRGNISHWEQGVTRVPFHMITRIAYVVSCLLRIKQKAIYLEQYNRHLQQELLGAKTSVSMLLSELDHDI